MRRSEVQRVLLAKQVRSFLSRQPRSRARPIGAAILELYTHQPARATAICADELDPVIARTFPPAPVWLVDDHRAKAPLQHSRGTGNSWIYDGLRIRDEQ